MSRVDRTRQSLRGVLRTALLLLGIVLVSAVLPHEACAHIEADGLIVTKDGATLIHVWQGVVHGALTVPLGGSTGRLDVQFLSPDSVVFTPGPAGQTWLKKLIDAPAAVAYDSLGAWAFALRGLQSEATGHIYLRIWFVDHYDFTSPPIPFTVTTRTDVPAAGSTTGEGRLAVLPNPLRSLGAVRFGLDRPGPVVLTLHDTRGRLVREVVRGGFAAGEHSAAIDAAGLPAGVYFLRMEAGNRSGMTKVQVLR